MKSILSICLCLCFSVMLAAQPYADTRILNNHSPVTLKKGFLDFRITHRFGDVAGADGGWETLFGVEEASDIRIGFEYGITDKWMAGVGRTKGAGPAQRLLEGFTKYNLMQQGEGRPITLSAMGNVVFSSMQRLSDSTQVGSFPRTIHRFSYLAQLIAARQWGERFTLSLSPAVLHRNFVAFGDDNTLFFLGIGARIGLKEGFALLADYNACLLTRSVEGFVNPLSVGLEYETGGGHVFMLGISNNKGIVENDFLGYTDSRWQDGGFRFGFTIVRKFVP